MAKNSVLGEGMVGKEGVQSYDIYINEFKNSSIQLGKQMDAISHEVQHASIFSEMKILGPVTKYAKSYHHALMASPSGWISHEKFIIEANRRFSTNLKIQDEYDF